MLEGAHVSVHWPRAVAGYSADGFLTFGRAVSWSQDGAAVGTYSMQRAGPAVVRKKCEDSAAGEKIDSYSLCQFRMN